MVRLVNLDKLPNGNLRVTLTDEGIDELPDIIERCGVHSTAAFDELIEYQLCNGWDRVPAEAIGALTSCDLIISDDVEWDEDREEVLRLGRIYWHPNYMVESPVESLQQKGKFILTGVE